MKGRVVVPYSLVWAVLVASAGVGGSGCTSNVDATQLEPEGPPAIKEIFVNSRSGNGLPFSDPRGQGNSLTNIDGGDLIYGLMGDVGQCTFDSMCPEDMGFPAGYTCEPNLRICVGGDGKQEGAGGASLVQSGIIFGTKTLAATPASRGFPVVQIVFKELLDPATVEQFACACSTRVVVAADGTVTLQPGNCPGGKNFTTDLSCSDCPENPDTNDTEAGSCFDINDDGVYDLPSLLPGLVRITCTGTDFSYSNGTVSCATVNGAGVPAAVPNTCAAFNGCCDGFYDPSGNQIVTIDAAYLGLGPRLYLYPGFGAGGRPMPADTDCQVTVANTIKDKDGLPLDAPTSTVKWHTEPVQRVSSAPAVRTLPDSNPSPPAPVPVPTSIGVVMSTLLNPATVATDTMTVTSEPSPQTVPPTAPVAVAGATALSATAGNVLVWTPAAALAGGQKYTVTIAAGIEDTYGKPMADIDAFYFITAVP